MKRCAALALCAAALAPGGLALKVAEARAQAWLRQHRGAPQQDELEELRVENPEAYGIVKALLTKRSLGLLDPRHPTASFAAAPPQEAATPGAEAFEKIAEESGEKPKAAPLYADAPVASHQNWLNWKPQQSAMDDEAMVKNVLGAVAELKGGASLRGAAPAAEAPEAPEAPPQPQLASVDAPAAPAPQENSYLAGLNLDGESAPAAKHSAGLSALKTQEDGTNYLASFSWDDGAKAPEPQAQAAPAQAAPAQEVSTPAAPAAQPSGDAAPAAPAKKKNALLAWLGGGNPAPAAPVAAKPTQAGNSYIMDLA